MHVLNRDQADGIVTGYRSIPVHDIGDGTAGCFKVGAGLQFYKAQEVIISPAEGLSPVVRIGKEGLKRHEDVEREAGVGGVIADDPGDPVRCRADPDGLADGVLIAQIFSSFGLGEDKAKRVMDEVGGPAGNKVVMKNGEPVAVDIGAGFFQDQFIAQAQVGLINGFDAGYRGDGG